MGGYYFSQLALGASHLRFSSVCPSQGKSTCSFSEASVQGCS